MSTHLSTAPHRSRKKRELTRAVETLKKGNGGGIVRLTQLSLSAAINIKYSLKALYNSYLEISCILLSYHVLVYTRLMW